MTQPLHDSDSVHAVPPSDPGAGAIADLSSGIFEPGTELGSYRLLELLGKGGMGEVYKAVHRTLGKVFAIKLLRSRYAEDRHALQRFFREAQAACRIDHPNIVAISDFVEDAAGVCFYVMEYLEGESLADRLDRGPLRPAELLPIARQTVEALEALHQAGVIHRDLKPGNIFLTTRAKDHPRKRDPAQVKVLDFGLAKLEDSLGRALDGQTNPNFILGTPEYMAPEQIRGAEQVDLRIDIYALGVVLYEALTGRRPIVATTAGELLVKVITDTPRPLSALLPDVLPALETLVMGCLAKEPSERPTDAILVAELTRLEAELTPEEPRLRRSGEVLTAPPFELPRRDVTDAPSPAPPSTADDRTDDDRTADDRTDDDRTDDDRTADDRTADDRAVDDRTEQVAALRAPDLIRPRRRPRWQLPLLVALGAAAAGLGLWWALRQSTTTATYRQPAAPAQIARLAELWRGVRHRAREGQLWAAAERGMALAHLDTLRTAGGARAEVTFDAGGRLEVGEEAEVLIEAPRAEHPGGPKIVQVAHVRRGVVRGEAAPGHPLRVIGRSGRAAEIVALGDKPARFRVREGKDGRLEVALLGGRARLRVGAHSAELAPNQLLDVGSGPLGRPLPLLPYPELLTPAVDARPLSSPIALRWKAVPGAASYRIQLSSSLDFARRLDDRIVAGTTTAVSPAKAGRYVWRVRSIDGSEHEGEFGYARRFELIASATPADAAVPPDVATRAPKPVRVPPREPPPSLLSPPAGVTLEIGQQPERVVFRWKPAHAGARLVVALHPSLRRDVLVSHPVHGESAELSLTQPGRYYWGLCTKAGCPAGSAGPPRLLSITRRPPPKVVLPPIDWKKTPKQGPK